MMLDINSPLMLYVRQSEVYKEQLEKIIKEDKANYPLDAYFEELNIEPRDLTDTDFTEVMDFYTKIQEDTVDFFKIL